jgi:DNA-directed RNA polymerase subunit alpha
VRARRALQLLGVQSIGELAARTEAELMGVKNFGQNSLDEIKRKLVEMGLSLRELD